MKRKKKILVITDHMPWGHRSIAKAIYNFLKQEGDIDLDIRYAEIKSEAGFAIDIYKFFYRYYPSINRLNNKLISSKIGFELLKEGAARNLVRLKKEVDGFNPDLIISCYFLHSHSLANWRKKKNKKFKLWTIVADPWTANPISYVNDADYNLVYDQVGVNLGKKRGIKKEKLIATGWWVRPEMYKQYDREKSRKKLGFSDNRPIIFVGGGSLGTSALPRILPILMMIKKKIGIIFNSGTDEMSYSLVEEYDKLFKKVRKDDYIQIKNLGWIENMAEVLSACDIVFGKAGPNFLFDVMAANKPFVAITHIGGQEDGNIDLILKKKLGWVKESNKDLGDFLLKYVENPNKYSKKYLKNIKQEAELNKKSLSLILKKIRSE